jgi:hypothetical protein
MRQQADADKDELYKQIGQLKVELDFLKKRLVRGICGWNCGQVSR